MKLRDYQQAAIDALYGYFSRASGNPLLVLPTGAGKSLVNAEFVRGVIETWPHQRVLCLTHVRELIEQNFKELVGLWPEAPAGINSASVGRRDTGSPILFAGIQSIYKKAMELGWFDLILVDEAHLIPAGATGMYRTFLSAAQEINPAIKIVGLTATPYRLGQGMLHEGKEALFSDIAYEVPISLLLERGYLAPLVTPEEGTETKISMAGVGTRGGEFIAAEMAAAVDQESVTHAAVNEIVTLGQDRKSWLIFCSSVAHAEHVSEAINARGILCDIVTGSTAKGTRDSIINNFKAGHLRALVNVDVLTTGFNAPNTDLIAFLRPTQSPGLYLQMVGRGMRNSPETGKTNCLVLDFAGNIERHGPVDNVRPPKKPGDKRKGGGDMIKVCAACGAEAHLSARYCPSCLEVFPVKPAHEESASTAAIMSSNEPANQICTYEIDSVHYSLHAPKSEGKRPSLRADYFNGFDRICSEWICLEHDGYARKKAENWWAERVSAPVPETIEEAISYTDGGGLPVPEIIHVDESGQFSRIIGYDYGDQVLPVPVQRGQYQATLLEDSEFDEAPF